MFRVVGRSVEADFFNTPRWESLARTDEQKEREKEGKREKISSFLYVRVWREGEIRAPAAGEH